MGIRRLKLALLGDGVSRERAKLGSVKNRKQKIENRVLQMPNPFRYIAAIAIVSLLVFSVSVDQSHAQDAKAMATPVAVQSVVFLTPSNSRISFVGIHVGDDPKPRLGGFKEFQGNVVVDPVNNAISSVNFDINIDSVWTQFEKLTGHLKNADFFETDKYPNAKFVSSSVEAGDNGTCTVKGDLTLHGETKEFSFPAKFQFVNGGLLLNTKFQLDRSQFGMTQMLSGVEKLVEVEIAVGEKTAPATAAPGNGSEKKKQSSTETESKMQLVSLKLPNMT